MPSPLYPIPWKILPGLALAVLTNRRRSFRSDSIAALSILRHTPEVRGQANIPARGPFLLVSNHFSRPGFNAWWLTFALSAALPAEVYWIMTGAWIFPGMIYEAPMRILSTWLFPHIARVYGFTTMTPIEPYSSDVRGRARSVRRILEYTRSTPSPLIGLAPEGIDHPGGVLGPTPPGSGRFIAHLAPICQVILPVGVFEEQERLCAQFGIPYRLEIPAGLPPDQLDAHISRVVMHTIASLLPAHLRGEYRD